MAMDLIDRLRIAVKASGINRKTIAQRANMNLSTLSRLLRHEQKRPSIHDIEVILDVIGRSIESLYSTERDIDPKEALRVLNEFVEKHEGISATKRPRSATKRRPRTVQPFSAAATPNATLLDDGRPLPRKRIPDDLWEQGARFAAQVVGDSMIDAGIENGVTVFFRTHPSPRPPRGKIIVCRVNTSVYVKRLQVDGDEWRLLSENEAYGPLVIEPNDEVQLYGVVVQRLR